jgi:hypothetical protein
MLMRGANRMMQRTTIVAPEEVLNRLRHQADDRGVSLATVIRAALKAQADKSRPVPQSLGMYASEVTDISRRSAEERPEPRSWR